MKLACHQAAARRLAILWRSAACALAMALGTAAGASALEPTVLIDPQGGPDATVKGNYVGISAREFLGIRYSDAGRFVTDMTPLAPSGEIQAKTAGPVCPQVVLKSGTPTVVGDEKNCLVLNVWTPLLAKPTSKLPVLVFIHGGAFVEGASTGVNSKRMLFDGAKLVNLGATDRGLVVVTLNYRLGTLGFLASAGSPGLAGNYGFQDQVTALKWVQKYISYFGGDPGRVTLVGQSAGAISVGLHAWSSRVSSGLFQAVIMESNPLGLQLQDPATARKTGQTLLDAYQALPPKVPCATVSCLQNDAAFDDLTMAGIEVYENGILSFANATQPNGNNLLAWAPNLDGTTLAAQPLAGAKAKTFTGPVLLGTNRDEGTFFEYLTEEVRWSKHLGGVVSAPFYDNFLSSLFARTTPPPGLPPVYVCDPGSRDCGPQFGHLITDYLFTCATHRLASLLPGSGPTFAYQFEHVPHFHYPACNPFVTPCLCDTAVCHSAELPFVWDHAAGACELCLFSTQEETLAGTLSRMWASVVSTGDPNTTAGGSNTTWPRFGTGNYLLLDVGSFGVSTTVPADANCAYWDKLGYEGIAP